MLKHDQIRSRHARLSEPTVYNTSAEVIQATCQQYKRPGELAPCNFFYYSNQGGTNPYTNSYFDVVKDVDVYDPMFNVCAMPGEVVPVYWDKERGRHQFIGEFGLTRFVEALSSGSPGETVECQFIHQGVQAGSVTVDLDTAYASETIEEGDKFWVQYVRTTQTAFSGNPNSNSMNAVQGRWVPIEAISGPQVSGIPFINNSGLTMPPYACMMVWSTEQLVQTDVEYKLLAYQVGQVPYHRANGNSQPYCDRFKTVDLGGHGMPYSRSMILFNGPEVVPPGETGRAQDSERLIVRGTADLQSISISTTNNFPVHVSPVPGTWDVTSAINENNDRTDDSVYESIIQQQKSPLLCHGVHKIESNGDGSFRYYYVVTQPPQTTIIGGTQWLGMHEYDSGAAKIDSFAFTGSETEEAVYLSPTSLNEAGTGFAAEWPLQLSSASNILRPWIRNIYDTTHYWVTVHLNWIIDYDFNVSGVDDYPQAYVELYYGAPNTMGWARPGGNFPGTWGAAFGTNYWQAGFRGLTPAVPKVNLTLSDGITITAQTLSEEKMFLSMSGSFIWYPPYDLWMAIHFRKLAGTAWTNTNSIDFTLDTSSVTIKGIYQPGSRLKGYGNPGESIISNPGGTGAYSGTTLQGPSASGPGAVIPPL